MRLQDQYKSETDNKAMYRKDGSDYHTSGYVHWLEELIDVLRIEIGELKGGE